MKSIYFHFDYVYCCCGGLLQKNGRGTVLTWEAAQRKRPVIRKSSLKEVGFEMGESSSNPGLTSPQVTPEVPQVAHQEVSASSLSQHEKVAGDIRTRIIKETSYRFRKRITGANPLSFTHLLFFC